MHTQVVSHNFHISKGKVEVEWFSGGVTNVCYNALDRHVESGRGDQVAFYWCVHDIKVFLLVRSRYISVFYWCVHVI